jgi:hypothetical protein
LRQHVIQGVYLRIGADLFGAYHQLDGDLREVGAQSGYDGNRRIAGISNTEDDLELRIILAAKAGIVLIGVKVGAAKRNQNGNRCKFSGTVRRGG